MADAARRSHRVAASQAAPPARSGGARVARGVLRAGIGLAASVAVGLLLCELLARAYEHVRCVPQSGAVNRFDPFYGWGNRAGMDVDMRSCVGGTPEFSVTVTTDSRGFRGPDRPPGERRVLVLGDSFTAGMQVADDEVYPHLLEQRLNARGGRRVEVLNAGVNGWSTDNALLFWRREGRRLRPDLVLLAFDTTNDLFENQRRLVALHPWWPDKPHARLRDGVLSIENSPLPPLRWTRRLATDVASFLVPRSGLFRIAAATGRLSPRLFFLPPPIPPADAVAGTMADLYRRDPPEVWREAWRITRGLVLRLRDDVERRGARFAVVIINAREEIVSHRWDLMRDLSPELRDVPLDRDMPDRLVRRFLARRGIPAIPLLEVFREHFTAGPPGFYAWNMHWAPAGHALAARTIADEIERQGLLPDTAQRTVSGRNVASR